MLRRLERRRRHFEGDAVIHRRLFEILLAVRQQQEFEQQQPRRRAGPAVADRQHRPQHGDEVVGTGQHEFASGLAQDLQRVQQQRAAGRRHVDDAVEFEAHERAGRRCLRPRQLRAGWGIVVQAARQARGGNRAGELVVQGGVVQRACGVGERVVSGRRRFEPARVIDRDAFEGRFAAHDLVEVEQHPPRQALGGAAVGRLRTAVQARVERQRGGVELVVGVQDRRFLDHRGAGGRGHGIRQVFRAQQHVGVLVGQGRAAGTGHGGGRAPAAAPRFVVEDGGGHFQFDLVDLGGRGARDFALAFALRFLGFLVDRHARDGAGRGRTLRARVRNRLRLRRIAFLLQEIEEPHAVLVVRRVPVETLAWRREWDDAHA